MVERCVEAVPDIRASFLVVDDSFGFTKVIKHYGYTVHFAPASLNGTQVTMESFYTPANPLASVMNRVLLKRKFAGIIDTLLGGLAELAEQRHRAAT